VVDPAVEMHGTLVGDDFRIANSACLERGMRAGEPVPAAVQEFDPPPTRQAPPSLGKVLKGMAGAHKLPPAVALLFAAGGPAGGLR
jgi:hypothetical protein